MKPIEHDTAIDWLKQTCAVIREMDAENKKLKEALKEILQYSQIHIKHNGIHDAQVNTINQIANKTLNGL